MDPVMALRERRRAALRALGGGGGLDFVETQNGDARQATLRLHFVGTVPAGLTAAQVRLHDAAGRPIPSGLLAVRELEEDATGYTVRVEGELRGQSVNVRLDSSALDPHLREAPALLPGGSPTERPQRPRAASAPRAAAVEVDTLARDTASFRRVMLSRLATLVPGGIDEHDADGLVALVDALAFSADQLAYYQDAVATEAFLHTARSRVSLRRHARLLDYPMHEGCNARVWVHAEVDAELTLPAGTALCTRVGGFDTALAPGSSAWTELVSHSPVVFELVAPLRAHPLRNRMALYAWGAPEAELARGATEASLLGDRPLRRGDILVFESGELRHAVRLSAVEHTADALGGWLRGESGAIAVTRVRWDTADALPFALPILRDGAPVATACGNVALADHGRSLEPEPLDAAPESRRYRPRLHRKDLTFRDPASLTRESPASATLRQDPRAALPALELWDGDVRWTARRDLLHGDPTARAFVVEMQQDRVATLRFDEAPRRLHPAPGVVLTAHYRVGSGAVGNIGRDTLAHVATAAEGVLSVRNPLPAQGGLDPESPEAVRRDAPRAFTTQERAVTAEDYARAAERHPEVEVAVARVFARGDAHVVQVAIDGRESTDSALLARVAAFLDTYRLIGDELEVVAVQPVALELALRVSLFPTANPAEVEQALRAALGVGPGPDGQPGLFYRGRWGIGQVAHWSQVVSAARRVPGVRQVHTGAGTLFRRLDDDDAPTSATIDPGAVGRIRLDDDPARPGLGRITLTLERA